MSHANFALMFFIIKTPTLSRHGILKHFLKVRTWIVGNLNLPVWVKFEHWIFLSENITLNELIHQFVLDVDGAFIEHDWIFAPLFTESLV